MIKTKICGLRTAEDIAAVNQYRPDYIGFVFASGRRRITPETAAKLKQALAKEIQAVGVFVNEAPAVIARLVADGIIDLVQLHGDEDDRYRRNLKQLVDCTVIQAVPVGERIAAPLPQFADFLLFDTASAARRGGTGRPFDWSLLKEMERPFFLAGGLNEANVQRAIAAAAPYCVDTSSGVESDAKKDAEKIQRFIECVRRG